MPVVEGDSGKLWTETFEMCCGYVSINTRMSRLIPLRTTWAISESICYCGKAAARRGSVDLFSLG